MLMHPKLMRGGWQRLAARGGGSAFDGSIASITGVTVLTQADLVLIPKRFFTPKAVLRIHSIWSCSTAGNSSNKFISVRWGTQAGAIAGSTSFGSATLTGVTSVCNESLLYAKDVLAAQVGGLLGVAGGVGSNTPASQLRNTLAVDADANDVAIYFGIQPAVAGDVINLEAYCIELLGS